MHDSLRRPAAAAATVIDGDLHHDDQPRLSRNRLHPGLIQVLNKKIGFLGVAAIIVVMIAQASSNMPKATDAQIEEYAKSPDGRKIAARVILGAQFPGWCDWSSAVMVVHSNGDVFARCNGDFGVDTTRRVAMRLK